MQRAIISNEGFQINTTFSENPELKDGEKVVPYNTNGDLVRPKWTGTNWIEGATTEEIEKYNIEFRKKLECYG